jgi:hypothetical protein
MLTLPHLYILLITGREEFCRVLKLLPCSADKLSRPPRAAMKVSIPHDMSWRLLPSPLLIPLFPSIHLYINHLSTNIHRLTGIELILPMQTNRLTLEELLG